MNIVKSSRLLLSMACAISLSACVSFLPDPAPADVIYRLSSQSQTVPAKSDAWVLRIDRPSAAFIFQNQDIIISPDGQRLAAASQAKWAEVTPVLVQEAMVDILSERANLVGVLPASGARTDTRLHLTIKKFEAHFDNGEASSPLAVVEYDVVMAQASTRNLIDTMRVRKTVRAGEARVSSIVEAISQANRTALNDVADWVSGLEPPEKS